MYRIKESIIVEGIYDKIKLSRFIDGIIFTTNGFCVFSNKDMMVSIKKLAEKTGIVILTDSDSAGFKIRNYIKQNIPKHQVKHAYIPDVYGKEKRKVKAGKEGLLGVEGINDDIILEELLKAGCSIDGSKTHKKQGQAITKTNLYADGFSGGEKSASFRKILSQEIGLPSKISSNMLVDVLNKLLNYDEYVELVQNIKNNYDF